VETEVWGGAPAQAQAWGAPVVEEDAWAVRQPGVCKGSAAAPTAAIRSRMSEVFPAFN